MRYTVECFKARYRGSIGIFHHISLAVKASDKKQAEAVYRNLYETLGSWVIVLKGINHG